MNTILMILQPEEIFSWGSLNFWFGLAESFTIHYDDDAACWCCSRVRSTISVCNEDTQDFPSRFTDLFFWIWTDRWIAYLLNLSVFSWEDFISILGQCKSNKKTLTYQEFERLKSKTFLAPWLRKSCIWLKFDAFHF